MSVPGPDGKWAHAEVTLGGVLNVVDPDGYLSAFAETVADFDPSKMPKK